MTDWTKLDVDRLADALARIYVSRGWAEETAQEDARELISLVVDKLDMERLARALHRVYPNPYSATMAAQLAGEYELSG